MVNLFCGDYSLDGDANILFDVNSLNIYDGVLTERQTIYQNLLEKEIVADLNSYIATSSALHKKLLNMASVKYLISPFKIDDEDLILVKTIEDFSGQWPAFYIYDNLKILPRVRMLNSVVNVDSTSEALEALREVDFNPEKQVILEKAPKGIYTNNGFNKAVFIKTGEENILVETNSSDKNVLLLADSYYPAWQAFIDGIATPIYPANINQRAVLVPSGSHTVQFLYKSDSFEKGKLITFLAIIIWVSLFSIVVIKEKKHDSKRA